MAGLTDRHPLVGAMASGAIVLVRNALLEAQA